jgi:glutaredoxin/glutathione-dependent peroxiredoxin
MAAVRHNPEKSIPVRSESAGATQPNRWYYRVLTTHIHTRSIRMTIKAGDKMPSGTFTIPGPDGPQKLTTDQLFAGKKVVLFSVPGAFTPTCDARHLPGFVQHAADFKAKGIDTVACLAVNDVFVMKAWAKASAVEEKVLMLADGNAEYSKALGLEFDATGFGMGIRGKRFALVVDNGVAKHVLVEGPGEFKVSSAEHVLGQL